MTHRIGPAVRDAHRQHVADVAHDLEAGDTITFHPKWDDWANVQRRTDDPHRTRYTNPTGTPTIDIDDTWCMP